MRKTFLALGLAATLFLSSCIGSFALYNKVLDWNQSLGSKFVNEVVFLALSIVPVYEVSLFVDGVVLNTIEFWTGSNPVASNTQTIDTENGKYLVQGTDNGYTIINENNDESIRLIQDENGWSLVNDDALINIFEYVDADHVKINMGGDETVLVELSAEGVNQFRDTYYK